MIGKLSSSILVGGSSRSRFSGAAISIVLLALSWLGPGIAMAQSFTASLQGTATDPSGAAIPRVRITLTNEQTNVQQTATSDGLGRYVFVSLPPGTYKIVASAPGFNTFIRSGMQLQVQQQAAVDLALSPGDITTSITVADEAPRLDAVSATLGRVVDNKAMLDMPLVSRDALSLVMLTPGVVGSPAGASATGTNFIAGGTRNAQSDVLIDGVTDAEIEQGGGASNTAFKPSVETIQEFKVQTNSFSAEFGKSGGTVVNMVVRSGTNELHGSAFEFHRNSALNANNFFSNRSGRSLVPFHRNQFGGAAGGPVWIPKMYDGRNRTFFFSHYEGTRQSQQTTTTTTLPTELQKQGDFSETRDAQGRLKAIYDPESVQRIGNNYVRTQFPGNVIPATRLNPVALRVLKFYPKPNLAGVRFTNANNYFNQGARVQKNYQSTMKIDHNFTDAQRLSVRYSRTRNRNIMPDLWGNWMNPGGTGPEGKGLFHNAAADYTVTLSPTSVLNLRWGLVRNSSRRASFAEQAGMFDTFGIQGALDVQLPPLFTPDGYSSVGTTATSRIDAAQDVNHFVGSLTRIAGGHMIKVGGDARLYRLNYAQPGMNSATFSFSARSTMADPFRSDSLQGDGLASMLLGWMSSAGQNTDYPSSWATKSFGLYLQDDIKVTHKLTVNLGLRYENDRPRTERFNRASWFDTMVRSPISVPQFPNLRGGMMFANDNIRNPFDADSNNFGPRVGFAYQVVPETVVRGGYGIYYGLTRAQLTSTLGQGFKTSTTGNPSLDGGVTQYAGLSRPFPDGISVPPGSSLGLLSYIGLSVRNPIRDWCTVPYYQQWSFSIERELPANSVVEISYVGNHGVHLPYGGNEPMNRIPQSYYSLGTALNDMVANPFYGVITDPLSPLSKARVTRDRLLRPYPQFEGITGQHASPNANSIYHAAQVRVSKRYSHDLTLNAHYTFSKMIDDSSLAADWMSWLGGATSLQSYDNLRLERSVSAYDMTHRFVLDSTYALPLGRGKAVGAKWSRWLDLVAGGWQMNGIITVQSGFPLVPGLSYGILPYASQRPNLLYDPKPAGPVVDRLNRYLDPAAFSTPAPYTFGNAPRTLSRLRAPGLRNLDASLFKNFRWSESNRQYLQLRVEAFNLTNTPIFGAPVMSVGSSSFGVISSIVNAPRELQVAAKIYF